MLATAAEQDEDHAGEQGLCPMPVEVPLADPQRPEDRVKKMAPSCRRPAQLSSEPPLLRRRGATGRMRDSIRPRRRRWLPSSRATPSPLILVPSGDTLHETPGNAGGRAREGNHRARRQMMLQLIWIPWDQCAEDGQDHPDEAEQHVGSYAGLRSAVPVRRAGRRSGGAISTLVVRRGAFPFGLFSVLMWLRSGAEWARKFQRRWPCLGGKAACYHARLVEPRRWPVPQGPAAGGSAERLDCTGLENRRAPKGIQVFESLGPRQKG